MLFFIDVFISWNVLKNYTEIYKKNLETEM